MFRKIFAVVLLLSFVLTACSGGAATEAEPPAPAEVEEAEPVVEEEEPADEPVAEMGDETIMLRVMIVDYVADKTDVWLEEEVVPAFQEEYPNVEVEFIYVNWGTLNETVQGYFAAGEGADILNLGSEFIAVWGDSLAPLNEYLGADAWPEIAEFVPAALDTVTWQGELRGLPWLTAPRAYMCRTDLLAESGFEAAPITFSEAVEQAGASTVIENNSVTRAGLNTTGRLDDWQEYISLIWALGGTLYRDNGEPNFDTPEAKAALQFMYDRRRAVYPDETVADLPEATGSRLADDSAVCIWANLWGAPPTSDPIWDNISLSPSLTDTENFPDSSPVVQVFNDWLAVPAYSPNIDTAVAFLKFLGSAENLNRYNSDFGSFPPRKDGWFGYVEEDLIMLELADLMDRYGVGFADVRESPELTQILQTEMPAFFTDLQDIDTTLANIQADYTRVLENAGRIQ